MFCLVPGQLQPSSHSNAPQTGEVENRATQQNPRLGVLVAKTQTCCKNIEPSHQSHCCLIFSQTHQFCRWFPSQSAQWRRHQQWTSTTGKWKCPTGTHQSLCISGGWMPGSNTALGPRASSQRISHVFRAELNFPIWSAHWEKSGTNLSPWWYRLMFHMVCKKQKMRKKMSWT